MLLCNAFHFYQPAWSAYFCLHDDAGNLWVKLLHQSIHRVIVGDVAQIDDEVLDIIHRGIAIFQQGADVFKQSAGLAHDVSFIDHISMLVDAGCARDEVLLLELLALLLELLASFRMEGMGR